ncbi:Hypothetical_protein [Hexamita inflata]|uniref:Hypothetical_protein n=1 Tax=Hexamita inflata TaxID=28002 RepID=A0AA86U1L7_9EUKA|nr:Hypothetical protein HINF_LOCUS15438 [Hexamita inflata]
MVEVVFENFVNYLRSGNTDKLNIISFQQNQQHKINLSTQLIFYRILTKTVVQLTKCLFAVAQIKGVFCSLLDVNNSRNHHSQNTIYLSCDLFCTRNYLMHGCAVLSGLRELRKQSAYKKLLPVLRVGVVVRTLCQQDQFAIKQNSPKTFNSMQTSRPEHLGLFNVLETGGVFRNTIYIVFVRQEHNTP